MFRALEQTVAREDGSAQSLLTSCQKVALHLQLQMLSDFLGHKVEEEVRRRGTRERQE